MHPILLALKPIVQTLIMRKVTEKVTRELKSIDSPDVIAIVDVVETAYISKKKVSGWLTVIISLVYFASSQGYIDPAIADLVNSILTNPSTVEAIEEVVN